MGFGVFVVTGIGLCWLLIGLDKRLKLSCPKVSTSITRFKDS